MRLQINRRCQQSLSSHSDYATSSPGRKGKECSTNEISSKKTYHLRSEIAIEKVMNQTIEETSCREAEADVEPSNNFFKWTSSKRYFHTGNLMQAITCILVLTSVFISVCSFEISVLKVESGKAFVNENYVDAPQLYNEIGNVKQNNASSSNFTLKIDAVQTAMDKLIKALTKGNSVPLNTVFAVLSDTGIGNITRPSQNDRVTRLENEMKKMKEDIEKLKQSSNISSEDKERLATLESSVETLQKLLDDLRLEFNQQIANLESLIDSLISTINMLQADLEKLKQKTEQEEEERRLQRLPSECIVAIKSRDFATAAKKLQEMNDDFKINYIIKEVYHHHESNFELALRFGESLGVKERSFLVFKALNYEMESNGHRDPFKRIKLIDGLRNGIIDKQGIASQLNKQAKSFEMDLKNSIKVVAKEKLKTAMLSNVYESNVEITNLSNEIYRISNTLFADLLTDVVNEVFGRVDTKKILKYVKSHSYIQQSIPGYSAVFNKIRWWNDDALFTIAYYIKEAMESRGYANLDAVNKATLNQIKGSLPQSLRNVVFASKVCIENVKYPKYLYAGKFLHDNPRRHVFTWMPGNRDVQYQEDHWQFIRTGESFFIFNVAHREFMYSPSEYKDFKQGNDRRKVFTWTEGGAFDSCKWNLELQGPYVYIKSVVRSEYLYTSNTYRSGANQKMFTWIPGGPVLNGLWSVVDCSNA